MKRVFAFLLLIIFSVSLFAQSDYELTQNFKKESGAIEKNIDAISSIDGCDKIMIDIHNLRTKFENHKNLLDKALYPDNFSSTLGKLETKLKIQRNNFITISNLEVEIKDLRGQIDALNQKNASLINEITELKKAKELDAEKISELEAKVKTLGEAIRKRDELVKTMVDSLLSDFVNLPVSLSDYEKKNLTKKVNSKNLFFNIERTINDNIEFMEIKPFTSSDIAEIKKQKLAFTDTWDKIGPHLSKFYLGEKGGENAVEHVKQLFESWEKNINRSIWENINDNFKKYKIELLPYNSSTEFKANVLTFISLEMKKAEGNQGELELARYHTFADSVWYKEINPNWLPMLEQENYLASTDRIEIETKIAEWAALVSPGLSETLIYTTCGVAVLIFFWFIFKRYSRKK